MALVLSPETHRPLGDTMRDVDTHVLREIKLEVTHRCCLRCIHCSSDAGPGENREMGFDDAVRIVHEAQQMGVTKLAISGGEAIIWPHILSLLEVARSSGMELSLYSSCIGDGIATVIGKLAEINGARLIVSLYSHKPEIHDGITQQAGSHAKTLNAVGRAIDHGVRTELHFTAMQVNYPDLPGVCGLARDRGVSKVSVLRLVPQGRSAGVQGGFFLGRDDNLPLRRLILEARAIIQTRVGSPYGFLHVSDSPQCKAGVDRLIVLPDLTVSPCDAFKQVRPEQIAGSDEYSRLDRWSLAECWAKSPCLAAIREHLEEPHPSPCRDCAQLPLCLSGCTAQRFLAHGQLQRSPDPMCLRAAPRTG